MPFSLEACIWRQGNTALSDSRMAAQASLPGQGNLGGESQPVAIGDGLSSSLWEKQRKLESKVWPRPTKWIYNCAAPFLSFESPAIPPRIPNIVILKVPKRNWDLAYMQCCDRQVCRKPVYNISLDTSGSSTRQAVWESRDVCIPLQKAGCVKMANAPSFCTYAPPAAQKI